LGQNSRWRPCGGLHSLGPFSSLCNVSALLPAVEYKPVESNSGARETIVAGPYHNLIPYTPRSKRQMRREGETWGGLSPHHPTMGLGERRKLPQRGPGPPKIDFMHISSPKEAIWNTFSVFLSDGGAPQTSRGPGNFPFPPPLDGPGGIK